MAYVKTGEKKYDLAIGEKIYALASSPTGDLIAVGVHDRVVIFDIATRTQVGELSQTGDITSLASDGKGQWLASGSSESTAILWKVEGNTLTVLGNPLQLNGEPNILAFSPDGRWLSAGGSSGFACLWDIATVQEMTRIPHNDPVTSVSFSPDGKFFQTVSRKFVRIWDIASLPKVPKDDLIRYACSHLTSNFSRDDWHTIFGNEEYRLTCSGLPEGE